LIELFRVAMPAEQALWTELITGRELPAEQHCAALAAVQAFNRAADVKPWEHSPLSPRTDGPGSLRSALLAKVNGVEAASWRRFARKWWKHRDEEMAQWDRQRMTPARARAGLAAARRVPSSRPA
jgi:hypothetical protein